MNETVSKGEGVEAVSGDDVYFLDDKSDGEEGEGSGAGSPLSEQELVDLRRARVSRPLAFSLLVQSLLLLLFGLHACGFCYKQTCVAAYACMQTACSIILNSLLCLS